jgi:type I restriction enzyme S subunit
MTKKSDAPAIRFKGFSDAWEQRKFEEIAVRSSVICSDDTLPRVEYEDIVSGTGRLNKDIYAKQSIKSGIAFHQGDVLYGKLRPYLQNWLLPTFDGLAVGDFWVLQPQNADSSFLYRLIQSRQFDEVANQSTGTKMPRADWKLVSKTVFSIPSNISEQAAIGTYFTALDSLITLHQRKFEKLTNVKKSMLEKMFPQNGSSYPEIRFKGFTDPWEQRKFGEITSKYENPVPTPHDGYYRLGIRSHAKGTFHSYVAKGQELETAQMHRVAAGNFIVNITFGWEHAVAITDKNDAGKLVSHRFPQFSFAEGMVPEFFRYVIVDEKFRHHLWLASPGGAGRNRVLKLDEMLNYLMRFPSRDEQIKIAEFFRHLDNLITLHQRELEKLQNIKKSMLEKMFV